MSFEGKTEHWFSIIAEHRKNGRFKVQQPITPLPLVAEIQGYIPLKGDEAVLVLYTVEWAIYLARLGVKNITVGVEVHDPVIERLCTHCGFKYLFGILSIEHNMKFDVVVGNPPYNDGEKRGSYNSVWYKFVLCGNRLTKQDGFLSMITPQTWFSQPRINKGNGIAKVADIIFGTATVIETIGLEKHFPAVGSTFSYYIISPTLHGTQVTVNGNIIDRCSIRSALLSYSASIVLKLQSHPLFPRCSNASGGKHLSQTQDAVYQYPTVVSQNRTDYATTKSKFHNTKKAIFLVRTAFDFPVLDPIGNLSPPSGSVSSVYLFDTEQECLSFGDLFNRKLYKFIISAQRKHHGFLSMLTVSSIPLVDLSRSWTDEELYAHFNLAQEEIDYIEATVK
jgi:site-specific DNA-methyltransferase (adenine-specific)